MNRYQEAFDRLCKHTEGLQKLVFEQNNFNKNDYLKDKKTIKELVDKQTSRVSKIYYTTKYGNNGKIKRVDIICPCCSTSFTNGVRTSIGVFANREKEFIKTVNNQNYCWNCGHKLYWGEKNETKSKK